MGNWSKDIMGGDDALDIQSQIFEFCGVEQYPEDENEDVVEPGVLTAEILETQQLLIINSLTDDNLNYQVLGALMLNVGAKLLPEVSDAIINSLVNDAWAKKSLERRIIVNDFIEILQAYILLDSPIPTKEYSFHNISIEDWDNGKRSFEVSKLALTQFTEYCKAFSIILGVKLGYDIPQSCYSLICLVDSSNEDDFRNFIYSDTFEFNGLYDIKVIVLSNQDFNLN